MEEALFSTTMPLPGLAVSDDVHRRSELSELSLGCHDLHCASGGSLRDGGGFCKTLKMKVPF